MTESRQNTVPRSAAIERILARAREPIDPTSLTLWRVAFGLLMVVAVIRFFAHGWIDAFYIDAEYTFAYPGLEFIRPWPGHWMYVHFVVLGLLAVLMAAGIAFRAAAALFCVTFTYIELLDQTHYLNHYYLVSLLAGLCAFMPIGRGVASVPRWCLWVLRAQVGLVYLYAGIAKLGADWLLSAQPLSIWLAANSDFPVLGPLFTESWMAYLASWASAVFDLTIVIWLALPRTRAIAFAAVVGFHVVTAGLFNLGLFPWLMVANATLFFTPDWPRRLLSRPRAMRPRAPARPVGTRHRLAAACLGVYFAGQLLVPFRHLVYPGDVHWTEEGMRFSWKVMVAEKAGMARFTVRDPTSGRTWLVYPGQYLTRRQEKMMSVQPEMIRQFAHHLADVFHAHGNITPGMRAEVRAEVYVALNGRRSRPLVDPTVDLAAEPFSLRPYRWIRRLDSE